MSETAKRSDVMVTRERAAGSSVESSGTVSPSLENYIEALYELNQRSAQVRMTDLAKKLHIAKSSANRAVTSLVEQEFALHNVFGPIVLTEKGLAYALHLWRRHMILKTFLSDVLGIDPETADREAGLIGHVISRTTLLKFADYLAARETTSEDFTAESVIPSGESRFDPGAPTGCARDRPESYTK
jgi:Mn-dependent transcriptional regulator